MYMPPAVNALARMGICTGSTKPSLLACMLNCLLSFSFLHLLVCLIVIADNTQNGYVVEGTSLKTTLNRCGYSVALTLYAW